MTDTLLIGWTTVGSEAVAQQLAHGLVASGFAACVQIDAGVISVYRWEGAVQSDAEWRLMVKFAASQSEAVAAYIDEHHPYDVPQWVAVRAEHVAPAYLKWALGDDYA
ncbi:MAG: periplasmic divalent cation tolerance protein [Lentimonas sp.]|jgi:periplasmic divalent cation tolerance protein